MKNTQLITLNILYKKEKNSLPLLNSWLTSVFDIKLQKTEKSTDIDTYLNRNLLFINYLLQSISLPSFELPEILSIKNIPESSSQWHVKISLPYVAHVDEVYYKVVTNFAIQQVAWLSQRKIISENRNYIYTLIQTQIINKYKRISRAGKSTLPMLQALHQLEIPFSHLGSGIYQIGQGAQSKRIEGSKSNLDSLIGARLAHDKIMTSNLMRDAGLPAPVNGFSKTLVNAIAIAKRLKWPLVIKPIDADRGEGVTINVNSIEEVKVAFTLAKRFSRTRTVVVERQVEGMAHRIFIVHDKLIYAVKRRPISIMGDGKNKVSDLIDRENQIIMSTPPWKRKKLFPKDLKAQNAMNLHGFTLNSIPKKDEHVPLRIIESTADGGTPENITTTIHPDNIDISIRATKLFGLQVAGVDIITTDITVPWHQNGAIINEINFSPLLGGSEISKKYVQSVMKEILQGDGKVPIYSLVGEEALSLAQKKQKRLLQQGISCFITSHKKTFNHLGFEMILPFNTLYQRTKSLLLNLQVEAIILIIQTDEVLTSGLAVDKITEITIVDKMIVSHENEHQFLKKEKVEDLIVELEKNLDEED